MVIEARKKYPYILPGLYGYRDPGIDYRNPERGYNVRKTCDI